MLEKEAKRKRRHKRIRSETKGTKKRPRLSVFRSSRHIVSQLINDEEGKVLISAEDKEISSRKKAKDLEGKTAQAFLTGKLLAEKAKEAGITEAIFDRGGYKYHGRIKALREGALEGGLKV